MVHFNKAWLQAGQHLEVKKKTYLIIKIKLSFTLVKGSVILYISCFDVLGNFVKVAVELSQFGLHHVSTRRPSAGH